MNIKKHIPNFLTCCNLLCGCLGIIKCFESHGFYFDGYNYQNLQTASLLIFTAGIFDFLDGFAARLLKVTSSIGKELDSLADVISFGLLPGLIIFQLIAHNLDYSTPVIPGWHFSNNAPLFITGLCNISLFALIIPIFSALRLAKFNIDTRQTESFIGVPTPTNAILIASFPLILGSNNNLFTEIISNPIFLIAFSIIMSLLLVAELPLFALKFKNFTWGDNKMKYILLISSVVLLILLQWAAIPLIIFLYIILSFIENKFLKSSKPKV